MSYWRPETDIHGNAIVTSQLSIGGGFRKITHNFCDKCSWWQESTDVVDESCTDSGDQLTYNFSGGGSVIDLRHGRFTFEDDVTVATVAPNGSTMTNVVPTIEIDSTPLAQSNEDAASGDDRYTIDYVNGSVTFAVARGGAEVVTISCRRAGASSYTFCPDPTKRFILEDAEIDVSEDIDMTDTITTVVHGSHSIVTGGTVVPVQVRKYKTFHDFQASARRFWGPVPTGFGGSGGVASPKWTFEWQYSRADDIYDTANYVDLNLDATKVTLNKVEVKTQGDQELGGSFITMAFYGQETDETA